MTIHLVNLDRATDRLKRMERLLGKAGLIWERLPAVEGKKLDEATKAKWAQRLPDGRLGLTDGEIGCLLSHRAAWQKIAAQANPAVVMEDDVHLADRAGAMLADLSWVPVDADIVKVETTGSETAVSRDAIALNDNLSIARLRGAHFGTAGYIVTAKGAEKLLRLIGTSNVAIDHLMFDPQSPIFQELTTYQTLPGLCIQDQFLGEGREGLEGGIARFWQLTKRDMTLQQKAVREVRRLSSQIHCRIAGLSINPFSDRRNLRVSFG